MEMDDKTDSKNTSKQGTPSKYSKSPSGTPMKSMKNLRKKDSIVKKDQQFRSQKQIILDKKKKEKNIRKELEALEKEEKNRKNKKKLAKEEVAKINQYELEQQMRQD